jgi:histidinol dehydrogenase
LFSDFWLLASDFWLLKNQMLRIIHSDDQKALNRLLRARQWGLRRAEATSRRILEEVRRHGDRALVRYARQFEGQDLRPEDFAVSSREIAEAYGQVPAGFVAALRVAARHIRAVACLQLPQPWHLRPTKGVTLRQIVRPLESVACYIPGGRFALPSTVLMSAIPAQVAGVPEILITCPRPAPTVLVAADFLGLKRIFRLGGAQAVAAFAYGTESVPRADKIVGPGNRYVSAAKRLLAGWCGIDFVAGPTELVVLGSEGRPAWIAAELVAQAEHDADAVAVFITTAHQLALQVHNAVYTLLRSTVGSPVARQALGRRGAIILTRNAAEGVNLVNQFVPEHLTLLDDAVGLLPQIRAAGSIFLGSYSAVAAGDYAVGSNHILPTAGAARLSGGLSAADFVKSISVQRLSRPGLSRLRRSIVMLATTEGLKAHAHSVETRFADGPAA